MQTLINEVKNDEGYRSRIYKDTEGFLTIGYGLNLDAGISEELATVILQWQLSDSANSLRGLLSFWSQLSTARQEVFINMHFNLGTPKFLQFQRMLEAARKGNVQGVCTEMRESKWFKQVGKRAERLIEKYRIG